MQIIEHSDLFSFIMRNKIKTTAHSRIYFNLELKQSVAVCCSTQDRHLLRRCLVNINKMF